jgi:hypothetical protein
VAGAVQRRARAVRPAHREAADAQAAGLRQALPAPAQSAIDLAIEEMAGNNRALARYLSKQAAAMQQAKLSEDEIVAKLTKWRDPDADEAST